MAEQQDQDQRTEQASGRRLERAREDGDVPVARDAAVVAAAGAAALTVVMVAPALRDALIQMVHSAIVTFAHGRPADLVPMLARPAGLVVLVSAVAALSAAVAVAVQTRGGFWPENALPRFDRLLSGGRMLRMFRREMLGDLGFALVKFVTLALVMWTSLRDAFLTVPRLLAASPDHQLGAVYGPLAGALARIVTALVLLAGADLALTRLRFAKRMKMSKDEIKRENREEDGDPLMKGRRRRRHRDIIKGQIAAEVPRADVVVVNPTHIAVVLRYRPGEDRAPRVTAKGKGVHAEYIRELARSNGIPIVEDIPLARLLHRRVKVGGTVPMETYRAVAAILAFVYRVLGRSQGAQAAAGGTR